MYFFHMVFFLVDRVQTACNFSIAGRDLARATVGMIDDFDVYLWEIICAFPTFAHTKKERKEKKKKERK